jgi:hypothetical protein
MTSTTDIIFTGPFLVLLAFGVVALVLQVFLSKSEQRWPGLIMPIVWIGFSLITPIRILVAGPDARSFIGSINGVDVLHTPTMASIIGEASLMFILLNIVTGILVAIYLICKRRQGKERALLKMSVQDLG